MSSTTGNGLIVIVTKVISKQLGFELSWILIPIVTAVVPFGIVIEVIGLVPEEASPTEL